MPTGAGTIKKRPMRGVFCVRSHHMALVDSKILSAEASTKPG